MGASLTVTEPRLRKLERAYDAWRRAEWYRIKDELLSRLGAVLTPEDLPLLIEGIDQGAFDAMPPAIQAKIDLDSRLVELLARVAELDAMDRRLAG